MSTPFGPIFNFALVERWVMELAAEWHYTYLAEAARQNGETMGPNGATFLQTFSPLKSTITVNEWGGWPEEQLPCMLVTDTGIGDLPSRDGSGRWRARRLFGISFINESTSREDARWASGLYMAAGRSMLLQNQDLGHPEHIGGLDWTDERPAPVRQEDERSLAAQMALFYVDVNDIADEGGTPPPLPSTDPQPDIPVVEAPAPGESRITVRTRSIS